MSIDEQLLKRAGLTQEEYELLKSKLNREPTEIEVAIAGAMWSEHCSYKSSKIHLKKFPTKGKHVVIGPGENAGVVDIGGGYVAIFKMESHNHPSFIEPYQGAATGVGGIMRDIFTMGARPIANMDVLFFGHPDAERTRYLVDGVVRGIGDYGNCVGVPTVGGQTGFDESYNYNNLVNAFCLGLGKKDKIFLAKASGAGNPVIYVGSKTGADGIRGATMASAAFDEEFEKERPSVQVGDPFTEKLLLEACLELMEHDAIEGIQDMGAAGLTSSSFEMAQRAGMGIRLYLDRVPTRQPLTPEQIMLSESQERMLIVAKKGKEGLVRKIFEKWGLDAEVIGEVIEEKVVELVHNGKTVAKIDVGVMVEEAPVYNRKAEKPSYINEIENVNLSSIEEPDDYNDVLLRLISSPDIADKSPLYEQYDSTVQTNTLRDCGEADAAVLRIKPTGTGIALTADVNPLYVYINPSKGSKLSFIEAYRNLITVGAKPIALTDCLNFGNPENPEIMWQFKEATEGLAEICRKMNVPVVSGNVSFYNETAGKNILPTPTIGMVGIIDKPHNAPPIALVGGMPIYMLGQIKSYELGGSAYFKWIHSIKAGRLPDVNQQFHEKLAAVMIKAVDENIVLSAHDVSEGGIAVALAEMCIKGGVGAVVELPIEVRADAYLFSETQGVILLQSSNENRLVELCRSHDVDVQKIGLSHGSTLKINGVVDLEIEKLADYHKRFFKELFY